MSSVPAPNTSCRVWLWRPAPPLPLRGVLPSTCCCMQCTAGFSRDHERDVVHHARLILKMTTDIAYAPSLCKHNASQCTAWLPV